MESLGGIIGGILVVLILFACFIYPIWGIVHVAISIDRSARFKAIWILGLLFTWTLGALIYGIFVTREKKFKIATWSIVILSALILIGGVLMVEKFSDLKENIPGQISGEPTTTQ